MLSLAAEITIPPKIRETEEIKREEENKREIEKESKRKVTLIINYDRFLKIKVKK